MLHFHNYALVCETIPKSIVNGLSLEKHEPVNFERAKSQHKAYLNALKQCGINLISVEPNEIYPDCVFVEDTCVAVLNRIFITNPGAESRRGEIRAIRDKLDSVKDRLGLEIGQVKNLNEAFVDGGDVLFTGRELIVGLSTRTNQKGEFFIKKISFYES
jgi:dimethylargininase